MVSRTQEGAYRLQRYVHVLYILVRLVRVRFMRSDSNRQLARKALSDLVASRGGLAMKIGQVVADVDLDEDKRTLLIGAKGRPLEELMPFIENELGKPLNHTFQYFSQEASAASLGQVHKAQLADGSWVAVKVQYPYVAAAVASELKLLNVVPRAGPIKKWQVNLESYRHQLRENMERELNYCSESRRQTLLREALNVPGLIIPRVYEDLSTRRLLVQDWESGESLDCVVNWPRTDRQRIGRTLLMTVFKSLFQIGEVHGDPHLGNSFYRHDIQGNPVVVLLDFGCTIPVSKDARLALLKMMLRVREGRLSPREALAGFMALGFDANKLLHIASELPIIAQILFAPFLSESPQDTRRWRIKIGFEQVLGERRWWFRSAGPASLFLILRAFQGLVRQLERLEVELPWWPLLVKAVDPELLHQASEYRFLSFSPKIATKLAQLDGLNPVSNVLRVKVIAGSGSTPAEFSFPVTAILDLEEIIPSPVFEKILHHHSVDLDSIKQKVRKSNFAPQEILSLSDRNENYRVWIE